MKTGVSIFSIFLSFATYTQMTSQETSLAREHHAMELSDTAFGVLNQEEINEFHGLDYYEFDSSYQIEARFMKSKGKVFKMPTTTTRTPTYRRYGYIEFEKNGILCTLEVYQNMSLKKEPEYKNYLFLPFRDETSSVTTYGGGRFLDLSIPSGETITIDFNQAYNPYCAYSFRYSCPIPPACNTLGISIEAGEKTPLGH